MSESSLRSGFDTVISHGTVVDGSGGPVVQADVGITGGRIAAVGDLSGAPAAERLDVRGLAITPGFVDIHAHSDVMNLAFPDGENKVRQGITTEIAGNCGLAVAPLGDADGTTRKVRELSTAVDVPGFDWQWTSVGEYLDRLDEAQPAIDTALLAGHLAIRASVVGTAERAATPDEIRGMAELLDEALSDGAVGLSLGLMYPPSSYATFDEMQALGEVVERHGALLAVHMRDYSAGLLGSVDEALAVGAAAGCRLQISHLTAVGRPFWGTVTTAIDRIEAAQQQGIDVAFDIYPYLAGSTNLTQILPRWALDGGMAALHARLADSTDRQRIRQHLQDRPGLWRDVMLGSVPFAPERQGRNIAELADELGHAPEDVVMDLVLRGDPTMVEFGRSEDDLRAVLTHPSSMIGSDGLVVLPAEQNVPHPRAFGCYPGLLERYVRKEPVLGIGDAIRKCTSAPADRVGLTDRGRIDVGLRADLVVLDLDRVAENSTYEHPWALPSGIEHVMSEGQWVVRDSQVTGRRPGRAVRRG